MSPWGGLEGGGLELTGERRVDQWKRERASKKGGCRENYKEVCIKMGMKLTFIYTFKILLTLLGYKVYK
jgi:hypothetical protein